MLAGYIEQADAMVDTHVSSFRYKPGEFPDIGIGECAGKVVDFLRKAGVPVKGFTVKIRVILTLPVAGKDPIIEEIPIKESNPIAMTRDLLRMTVDDFFMNHRATPNQEIECKILFLIDETQLEE